MSILQGSDRGDLDKLRMDLGDFDHVIFLFRHVPVQEGVEQAERRVYGPPVTLSPGAEAAALRLGWTFVQQLTGFANAALDGDLNTWPVHSSPFPRAVLTTAGILRGMQTAWRAGGPNGWFDDPDPLLRGLLDEEPFAALDKLLRVRLQGFGREFYRASSADERLSVIQRATLLKRPEWRRLQNKIVLSIQRAATRERNIVITPALADFAMPHPSWWGVLTDEYKSRPRTLGRADTDLSEADRASIVLLEEFLHGRLLDTAHPYELMVAHDSVLRAVVALANGQPLRTHQDLRNAGSFPPGTVLGIRGWRGRIMSFRLFARLDPEPDLEHPTEGDTDLPPEYASELVRTGDFIEPGHWRPFIKGGPIWGPPGMSVGHFHVTAPLRSWGST